MMNDSSANKKSVLKPVHSREWLRIGIIGTDTSHAIDFTELLNNEGHPYHVQGGAVTIAYPGGSPDFGMSINRVGGFAEKLAESYGVEIVSSPEAVAERCDAILLEAVDGRVHSELFARIADYGKPVFIDKPLAVCRADAEMIAETAERAGVTVMSCSAVRFAEGIAQCLRDAAPDGIAGADCFGPMDLEPTQPGLFWYGIHTADMLYALLGKGCRSVRTASSAGHDMVVGEWGDGRLGTLRGNRAGNRKFGGTVHTKKATMYVDVYAHEKPYYASMLEQVMAMFRTGSVPVDLSETLEIIRFIEAANESRKTGRIVHL